MIFATVGAQDPYDRMVKALDEWAKDRGRSDVFAQIGAGEYEPTFVPWTRMLDPDEYKQRMNEARVIVAHAGMGSILTALRYGKQIVVMPRRAKYRENRNDHQLATAERFCGRDQITVAMDEVQLPEVLDRLDELAGREADSISPFASPSLIAELRGFIHGGS